MVGCPGQIDIGDRTIPNYDKFDLRRRAAGQGLRQLLQHHLRRTGQPDVAHGMTVAASEFDRFQFTIPGLTTVTGMVPSTVDLAERTQDGFGQGKVLVTPFGMALAGGDRRGRQDARPRLIAGTEPARPARTHRSIRWCSTGCAR